MNKTKQKDIWAIGLSVLPVNLQFVHFWENFCRTSVKIITNVKHLMECDIGWNDTQPFCWLNDQVASYTNMLHAMFQRISVSGSKVKLTLRFDLVFSSPFSIAITSLEEERDGLCAFRAVVCFARVDLSLRKLAYSTI